MGLFNKIKSIFSKKEEIVENLDEEILESEELDEEELDSEVVEAIETNKYVEGLSKSRDNFVNKLSVLGIKYTKISDDFYDELEEILITADVGVNTVMDFVERLII